MGVEVSVGYLANGSSQVLSPENNSRPLSQSHSSDTAEEEVVLVALGFGPPGAGNVGDVSCFGRVPHLIWQIEGLGDVAFDSRTTSSLGPVGVE